MMLRNCTETINSMDQSKDHGVYVESTRELLLYKRENSNLLWTSAFYANYMHSIQNIRVYFKINSIWHPGLINMGKEHVYVYISEWVYWLQVQRFWYPKFCFTSFTSPRDRYFPSKASITTNFYESITIKMQFHTLIIILLIWTSSAKKEMLDFTSTLHWIWLSSLFIRCSSQNLKAAKAQPPSH